MAERSVTHATFSVERSYPAAPARVFAAWADPVAKARWCPCHGEYSLDFRVGGREFTRGGEPGGPVFTTEVRFHDIVPGERIVYAYEVLQDDVRISVSIATVEFQADGSGTRLVFTDQGAYLDGNDSSPQREEGTQAGLDRLSAELEGALAGV
ncbi:MAG TPA: SRPBCC family protein [Longimicrobium sp.]|nr:SRPBCC family protein [Longimicrobium sp.]